MKQLYNIAINSIKGMSSTRQAGQSDLEIIYVVRRVD